MNKNIMINRAPVLTLWAAVVAEKIGYAHDEALTLAKAVSGLNAQSKGHRLGIYSESSEEEKPEKQRSRAEDDSFSVEVLGRPVPAVSTKDGIRATADGKPISAPSVQRYLEGKFGEAFPDAKKAMEELAESFPTDELRFKAYSLYESFRPAIPEGKRGWGAKGELDLEKLKELKKK